MNHNATPHIYIGTGGYCDTYLIGSLYPFGTDKSDFLTIYSQHYDAIEINSTFHAPIGIKALLGMEEKAKELLKFSYFHSTKSQQAVKFTQIFATVFNDEQTDP